MAIIIIFVVNIAVMKTITVEVNLKNKAAKALKELIDALASKPDTGVKLVSEIKYNPAFLKKIKESEKQIKEGKYTVLDTKDVWGSLGL